MGTSMDSPETFSNAIFDFVGHVARATTIEALQSRYLDGIGRFVTSSAAGLYVLNPFTHGAESIAAHGVSDFFLSRYEEFGRREDPVLHKVVAERRPMHNRQLMSLEDWTGLPIYGEVFYLHRMGNLLEAPLVVDDQVHGTLNFGRRAGEGVFTAAEQANAEAIAKLLGVVLLSVRARSLLERERDQVLAALELCSEAVVVTDLGSAERRMNAAARRLLARLPDADAGLNDLLTQPSRVGETNRYEAAVTLSDGTAALLCARSTPSGDDGAVIVTFLELIKSVQAGLGWAVEGLTRRQQQVAELAAGGLHDWEIAEQLHLSRYTVKQYLKGVYSKLGVRSRVDLTRLVLRSQQGAPFESIEPD